MANKRTKKPELPPQEASESPSGLPVDTLAAPQGPPRFRREQILGLDPYQTHTDLLMALLPPQGRYTLAEVDSRIHDFLKRRAT